MSGKFMIKVPYKTRTDLNNSVDWLMIQKKYVTFSHIFCFSIPILPTFITVDLNGCVQYCQLLPH